MMGIATAAKMATIKITTISSIKVKPFLANIIYSPLKK
jgi:hypothetical protein